jgi:hypothetical protein
VAANNLQQSHDVGGTKEVESDNEFRARRRGRDFVDVKRGGIRCQHSVNLANLVKLREYLLLRRHCLNGGLNNQIYLRNTFERLTHLN